jgi:predicted dehydrogenase
VIRLASSLRVGVIGVGHLGYHHARLYSEILGADLVGVVDSNEDRAHYVGDTMGVPSFTDFRMFLDQVKPDAISVAVPTSLHYQVASEALKRGIHVLVEKPVTTKLEEAEGLLRLAADMDLVLQVGHVERFNSAVQYVRSMVEEPLFIQTRRMGPFSPRISDVGVVLDLMIHDIDIILSMVNSEIEKISATGAKVRSNHEDIACAQITFKNGTIAHVLVSRVSEKRIRQMDIMERERYIVVDFESQDVSINRCLKSGSGLVEVVEHPVYPKKEPLKMELQHFLDCIREGRQPLVGIRDGKRALEVCVRVLRQIWGDSSIGSSVAV